MSEGGNGSGTDASNGIQEVVEGIKRMETSINNLANLIGQMVGQQAEREEEARRDQTAGQIDNPPRDTRQDDEPVGDYAALNAEAKFEQENFMLFNEEDVYHTLVDPNPRSRHELTEYARVAAQEYSEHKSDNLRDAFVEDFYYWTEENFKLVSTLVMTNLRDVLISQGIPIQKRAGLKMSKALADFVNEVRQFAAVEHGGGTAEMTHGLQHGEVGISQRQRQSVKPEGQATSYSRVHEEELLDANDYHRSRSSRPGDVGKLFKRESVYGGGPKEPIRRRFAIFEDACQLCGVDTNEPTVMFRLMRTTFLRGPALVYFMDVVKDNATTPKQAVQMLESHFLDERAKRVNDEVWLELSFDFIKSKRPIHKEDLTYEGTLNDLLNQITELADMRTGSGYSADVMAKTISAVRDVEPFSHVCRNPPKGLQELNSALRSCALEADRATIRDSSRATAYLVDNECGNSFSNTADELMDEFAYYVDRNLRANESRKAQRGKFKGYGNPPRNQPTRSRNRVPWNVCIVCHKEGCHSSKHRDRGRREFKKFVKSYLAGELDDDEDETPLGSEEEDAEESSTSMYVNSARAMVAMGIKYEDNNHLVDAAIIDTGSSVLSMVGEFLVPAAKVASVKRTEPVMGGNAKSIGGIGGTTKTKGTMNFYFLFGGKEYKVKLHIVHGWTPLIFSHRDLDAMGFNYQSKYKIIERPSDGYCEKVGWRSNLPHLVFATFGYFTSNELRTIHRNLGHPSLEKQMKVIESAEIEDLPKETRQQLAEIVKRCRPCQLKQGRPRRFLFSIRDSITREFNHVLQMDVVKLADGNVLHVIDTGTGFQNGSFLNKMDATTTWRVSRRCWIDVYAGAPDYIHTDAGSNFNSEEFKTKANAMGTVVKIAPTEGHDRIGIIERSHAYLRTVYEKLRLEVRAMTREDRLSMSFRAINDVPNSDTGISPTALVFGVHPKLPGGGLRGDMAQRANIIRQCTELVIKMRARRTLRDSCRKRNVASVMEMEKVRKLSPGSEVIVYREGEEWTPYTMVRVVDNNVDVILPSGKISTFGISNVRPFYPEVEEKSDLEDGKDDVGRKSTGGYSKSTSERQEQYQMVTRSRAKRIRNDKLASVALINTSEKELFRPSRMEEIRTLQELKCFQLVPSGEAQGHRLYRSTFVDKMKPNGVRRSRLCVAACNDQEHGLFTAAPTIKRRSLRLILAISATLGFKLQTRDVTKAFVMSKTPLRRPVYLRAPSEMQVPKGKVLKVIRPLYGMPESPMHWFKTYLDYHKVKLGMEQAEADPCLLFRRCDTSLVGIVGLQVDDTICAGTEQFLSDEAQQSNEFPSKGREPIGKQEVRFNGVDLSQMDSEVKMNQSWYLSTCRKVKLRERITFEEFRSLRAKLAYVAFSTVPEALIFVATLAQFTEKRFNDETDEAMRLLRKLQKVLDTDTARGGLKFVRIDPKEIEVVVCIDASFAVNKDKSSQLGMLVMLRSTRTGMVNIIHYTSVKSKRVCKSVLAAELFAFVDGFDIGFTLKDCVSKMLHRKVDLTIYTDSHTLYGLCISLAQTTENRLQIDLALIREAYERRDITSIIWINGKYNPADDFTKTEKRSGVLAQVVSTNRFLPTPQAWVQRDDIPVTTSYPQEKSSSKKN